jgi:ABC-type transport system involved in multi-copper enzyme maturation permease subunit
VDQIRAFFEGQLAGLTGQSVRIDPVRVIAHKVGWGGPGLLAALGTVLALTMMGTLTVTHLMLEEKKARTMEVLNVSPASAWHIVTGKAVAGVAYCLAASAAVFALNTAVILNWGLLIVATLCGACFTVALGLLLGSIFESRQQVTLWGFLLLNVLLLPVFLKIMTDLMPRAILFIFRFFPTVALSETIQLSFSNDAPLGQVAENVTIVLAGAVLLLLGVVWKMRQADR